MRLNLREVIENPGNSVDFSYQPDFSGLNFECVKSIEPSISAEGRVYNSAGVMKLEGTLHVDMICICSRCLKEFTRSTDLPLNAILADEAIDEENPDIFLLDGDYIDLDEVVTTAFVLDVEQIYLCSEDCKGLCPKCGKNLNDGPCSCTADADPRLAVLGQLLENN